jgi:hypothetical protein
MAKSTQNEQLAQLATALDALADRVQSAAASSPPLKRMIGDLAEVQDTLGARRAASDSPALKRLDVSLTGLEIALRRVAVLDYLPRTATAAQRAEATRLAADLHQALRKLAKTLAALAIAGATAFQAAAATINVPPTNTTAIYQGQPTGAVLVVAPTVDMTAPAGGVVLLEGAGFNGPAASDLHLVCAPGQACTIQPADLTKAPPQLETCLTGTCIVAPSATDPNAAGFGPALTLQMDAGSRTVTATGPNAFGVVVNSLGGGGGNGGSAYVAGNGGSGGKGANGGSALADFKGNITTDGGVALGAFSIGGKGGNGGSAGGLGGSGGNGGPGGWGGDATAKFQGGLIVTTGENAAGVVAVSRGGNGGSGGGSVGIFYSKGGAGDMAGAGGFAQVITEGGSISTSGKNSHGVMAQSMGGAGGGGGNAYSITYTDTQHGGSGGNAGDVVVNNKAGIATKGYNAQGIYATSIGGGGGDGGSGGLGVYSLGASGAIGGVGGKVNVTNQGQIDTEGDWAKAIYAQSIGGGGGNGGDALGAGAIGGAGSGTSTGGKVTVTNRGRLTTQGFNAQGIYASSVGGGGGNGGGATGFFSSGGSGGAGNDGDVVTVINSGDIDAGLKGGDLAKTSNAIFAQSVGGGGGNGGGAIAIGSGVAAALGGSGGAGGKGAAVHVLLDNASPGAATAANLATHGDYSPVIFAQSVGGGGGTGGYAVSAGGGGLLNFNYARGGGGGGGGAGGDVEVFTKGRIESFGQDSHGVFAQSLGGGGGNGGFAVAANAGGAFGVAAAFGGDGAAGGDAGQVKVGNYADILTHNKNSMGVFAQSVGGGGGNGGFAVSGAISGGLGLTAAFGGTGGGGGVSKAVDVVSSGAIATTGDNSSAIVAESIGGAGGNGGFSVAASLAGGASASLALGGSGGTGRTADTVTVKANGAGHAVNTPGYGSGFNIATRGDNSMGVFAQSVGGGGGNGGFAGTLAIGGAVGAGVALGGAGAAGADGKAVTVASGDASFTNNILTLGEHSTGILAQSIGGGGGNGGFAVALSGSGSIAGIGAAAAVGIGGTAGSAGRGDTVKVDSLGKIATYGDMSGGVLAQSVGGGGGNGGFAVSGAVSGGVGAGVAIGGLGSTGGDGGAVTLNQTGEIFTKGQQSNGLMAQSVGGGGGNGGFAVAAGGGSYAGVGVALGGGAGNGGKADAVTLVNKGSIRTEGVLSTGALAQTVGGSGGAGGFSVAVGGGQYAGVGVSLGGTGGAGATAGKASLDSTGTVATLGDGSMGLVSQSIGGGGGNGGFAASGSITSGGTSGAVSVALGGNGGTGGAGGDAHLGSTGDIFTNGANAVGLLAQSVGGGGGNGGFAGTLSLANGHAFGASIGGAGGSGNFAGKVDLSSIGTVSTTGDNAHGVQAQSVGGGGGNGGFAITVAASNQGMALGRAAAGAGGSGGYGGDVMVDTMGAVVTRGDLANAIFAQSVGGGGGSGGFAVSADLSMKGTAKSYAIGGEGGSGNYAGTVKVTARGDAQGVVAATLGDGSNGILAQSIGGGGGSGGFAVSGGFSAGKSASSNAVGGDGGAGNKGGDVAVVSAGLISTLGANANGILAQSVGGGGGSGGFSVALSGGVKEAEASAEAVGGKGGVGNSAGTVAVVQTGDIVTTGDLANGIFAQSVGGGGGKGGFAVAGALSHKEDAEAETVGGDGGSGGTGGKVVVATNGAVVTKGRLANAIFAQSVGGGGGNGGFAVAGALSVEGGGEASGVGGKGGSGNVADDVTVTSRASTTGSTNGFTAATQGDGANGILAQSIGGGGGNGGFAVSAGFSAKDNAASSATGGDGGTGNKAGTVRVDNRGAISTQGANASGVLAQSVGGGGGNAGFSVSAAASGDKSAVTSQSVGGKGGDGNLGGKVEVVHDGDITTLGDLSYGILAQSVGGGGGKGGFSASGALAMKGGALASSVGGDGGSGNHADTVTVTTSGQISTRGAAATAVLAQSIGGGGGNGGFSLAAAGGAEVAALGYAVGGKGGAGGDGAAVSAANTAAGNIHTTGAMANGVQAQSIGGGGGNGGFALAGGVAVKGAAAATVGGGAGGGGGKAGAVTASNAGSILTEGPSSIGVFAQSVGGGGGSGGFAGALAGADKGSFSAAVGGAGGVGGDAGSVTVDNSGQIATLGANSSGVLAQSIGGGGGNGGFAFSGSGSKGDASTLSVGGSGAGGGKGGDVSVANAGKIRVAGDLSYGVFAQSVGGGGGNGGVSVAGAMSTQGGGFASSIGGTGAGGGDGGNVKVVNSGEIILEGAGTVGVLAQSVGGGGGSGGFAGGLHLSEGGDASATLGGRAGTGGSGGDVAVVSTGKIATLGAGSVAVLAQSVAGGGGQSAIALSASGNSLDNAAFGLGGGGSGAGGGKGKVTVDISGGETVTGGDLSHGAVIQSVGGGGGVGSFTAEEEVLAQQIMMALGSTGSIDGDAAAVTGSNANATTSLGAGSIGLLAQSIGGGGGVQGVTGDLELARQIDAILGGTSAETGHGAALTFANSGAVETFGANAVGVLGQSIGGGGGVGSYSLGAVDASVASVRLAAGGGGAASDGNVVDLSKLSGSVTTHGALATAVLGQSIGGGGGVVQITADQGFQLAALDLVAGGAHGSGGQVVLTQSGEAHTAGFGAMGVVAQSIGGGGGQVGFDNPGGAVGSAKARLGGALASTRPALSEGASAVVARALAGGGDPGTAVHLTASAPVSTQGAAAVGVLAQSIGGGGGSIVASGVSSLDLVIGSAGGAGGDAAEVALISGGGVATTGAGAHGILAQSIGGGGGYAAAFDSQGKAAPVNVSKASGQGGSGGPVSVTVAQTVSTTGDGADGVIAQSIGGGGGLAGVGEGRFIGSAGGPGAAARVDAILSANVTADGAGSNAVVLQSAGTDGSGPITATVDKDVVLRGGSGSGAGLLLLGGTQNTVVNHGAIGSLAGVDGRAVIATTGDDAVENFGALVGEIDLGAGTDSLANRAEAAILSGARIALGAGEVFVNEGRLAPGGADRVQTTALLGDYRQSATGAYDADLDLRSGLADKLEVSGSAAVAGTVKVTPQNKGYVTSGEHRATLATAEGGLAIGEVKLDTPPSAIASYGLVNPDGKTAQLAWKVDFSPTGVNTNQTAVGDHLNAALSTPAIQERFRNIAAALFDAPDAAQLGAVYDRLTPEPQVQLMASALLATAKHGDELFSCAPGQGQLAFDENGRCFWGRLDGRQVKAEATSENIGFKEQAGGITFGGETGLGDGWRVGGSFGAEHSVVKGGGYARSVGDRYHAGLVVKKETPLAEVALAVTAGIANYNSARAVNFGGAGVAESNQELRFNRAALRVSKPLAIGEARIKPSVELSRTGLRLDGFQETGAGAINLQSRGQAQSFWRVRPGVEVWTDVQLSHALTLRPNVKLSLSQALGNSRHGLDARFEDAPAAAQGFAISVPGDRNQKEVEFGLDLVHRNGVTFRAGYTGAFAENINQQAVRLKAVIPF